MNDMDNIIANSDNKHPLVEHLLGVCKLSMDAAKYLGFPDDVVEMSGVAGLLHDIGKASLEFQLYVRDQGPWTCHNELSWVFSKMFSNGKKLNPVYQAIYWHHGTKFSKKELEERTHDVIWECQSEGSKDALKKVFNELSSKTLIDMSKYIIINDEDDVESGVSCPNLFEKLDKGLNNAKMLAIRGCLLFADRQISKQSTEFLLKYLNDEITSDHFLQRVKKEVYDFKLPEGYDKGRFEKQRDILKTHGKTTVVRGPAGFGKTIAGLMWSLNQGEQIYWVTPRNSVAEMVYQNILSELRMFGIDASVELYLSSEQKKKHGDVSGPCKADIVVTNIDNLLSPMVSNKDADRLFLVQAATVIFDEFHEFLTEEAMFAAFITYMKMRHSLSTSLRTMLLSATPSIIHEFWDNEHEKTVMLPNDGHFPAQHGKPYGIDFEKVKNVLEDMGDIKPKDSSLLMFNSIRNVQDVYRNDNFEHIIHSKFNELDRFSKTQNIFDTFGKGGSGKGTVVSAPVLQAAADISFKHLIKSIEGPESDIQVIGRINRWGESDIAHATFVETPDIRERGAVNVRQKGSKGPDKKSKPTLKSVWNAFFQNNYKESMVIDDIYKLYNSFNKENHNFLIDFYKGKLNESFVTLSDFYPKSQKKDNKKDPTRKISGKTLRSSPSCFIACKDKNGEWCDFTFQISKREAKEVLAKLDLTAAEMLRRYESLSSLFDTSEIISKMNPKGKIVPLSQDALLNAAHADNCPLPTNMKYSSEIGLYND